MGEGESKEISQKRLDLEALIKQGKILYLQRVGPNSWWSFPSPGTGILLKEADVAMSANRPLIPSW